ncbi:hypothetical protein NCLIV_035910 [Neospora caninum Liverpool]|uniref:Uncharacterized protein n=1 Tax=Neospora caninum (strain Liverpool) TaxID=572307 RepID=F0VJ99_NEOCL|nr:hypothetical protein NCLIV_035910 [Neospora caninum Liverpool]CBZ53810.1 hypothetical protein NCLIV_035910 [Neospora caninum Liverpool]CEL67804.1 TPA: hypothetical protein BN1204_035910 [Neospora caninum Liverpool]|eukprot:XP_003883842.1 hypothetical protein NCLIV_035910 [Neospora caninum Liverpool]
MGDDNMHTRRVGHSPGQLRHRLAFSRALLKELLRHSLLVTLLCCCERHFSHGGIQETFHRFVSWPHMDSSRNEFYSSTTQTAEDGLPNLLMVPPAEVEPQQAPLATVGRSTVCALPMMRLCPQCDCRRLLQGFAELPDGDTTRTHGETAMRGNGATGSESRPAPGTESRTNPGARPRELSTRQSPSPNSISGADGSPPTSPPSTPLLGRQRHNSSGREAVPVPPRTASFGSWSSALPPRGPLLVRHWRSLSARGGRLREEATLSVSAGWSARSRRRDTLHDITGSAPSHTADGTSRTASVDTGVPHSESRRQQSSTVGERPDRNDEQAPTHGGRSSLFSRINDAVLSSARMAGAMLSRRRSSSISQASDTGGARRREASATRPVEISSPIIPWINSDREKKGETGVSGLSSPTRLSSPNPATPPSDLTYMVMLPISVDPPEPRDTSEYVPFAPGGTQETGTVFGASGGGAEGAPAGEHVMKASYEPQVDLSKTTYGDKLHTWRRPLSTLREKPPQPEGAADLEHLYEEVDELFEDSEMRGYAAGRPTPRSREGSSSGELPQAGATPDPEHLYEEVDELLEDLELRGYAAGPPTPRSREGSRRGRSYSYPGNARGPQPIYDTPRSTPAFSVVPNHFPRRPTPRSHVDSRRGDRSLSYPGGARGPESIYDTPRSTPAVQRVPGHKPRRPVPQPPLRFGRGSPLRAGPSPLPHPNHQLPGATLPVSPVQEHIPGPPVPHLVSEFQPDPAPPPRLPPVAEAVEPLPESPRGSAGDGGDRPAS